jgi:N-acetylglucosaminyldiphosphoundecaprenol N-acetyl-beta-D-mannosaminyltransferase
VIANLIAARKFRQSTSAELTMSEIFGLTFSPGGLVEIAATIVREPIPEGAGSRLVVTANVDHIVQLRKRADFRAAYASAWLVTADGFPVYLYNRLKQSGALSRVTGSDLFANVMPRLNPSSHRVCFIASTEATANGLRVYLISRGFPENSISVCVPPLGFERDEAHCAELAQQVRQHQTTHLFIGLGAPKSEIWCHQNRYALGDCYILSVGAGLEFFLGNKKRAPTFVQRVGMEWLWRFAQEPQRLFRRYFIESWSFFRAIADDIKHPRAKSLETSDL